MIYLFVIPLEAAPDSVPNAASRDRQARRDSGEAWIPAVGWDQLASGERRPTILAPMVGLETHCAGAPLRDLAHKMIFPALFALAKRDALKVPVIGVASPDWSVAQLHDRVQESIQRSGGIDDERVLDHLLSLFSYVGGDYNDAGTFSKIKAALGQAQRPAHYLAIPPALFPTVITDWRWIALHS